SMALTLARMRSGGTPAAASLLTNAATEAGAAGQNLIPRERAHSAKWRSSNRASLSNSCFGDGTCDANFLSLFAWAASIDWARFIVWPYEVHYRWRPIRGGDANTWRIPWSAAPARHRKSVQRFSTRYIAARGNIERRRPCMHPTNQTPSPHYP